MESLDNQVLNAATREEGECSETEELVNLEDQTENSPSQPRKESPKGKEENKRRKSRHSKSEHTASRGAYDQLYQRLRKNERLSDLPRYAFVYVYKFILTCIEFECETLWHGELFLYMRLAWINFSRHENVSACVFCFFLNTYICTIWTYFD